MIRAITIRTYKVSVRNSEEAKQLSKEFAEYFSTHFPETNHQAFWQRFEVGLVTRYSMMDFEDLGAWDRFIQQTTWPDAEKLQDMASRWEDLVIEEFSERVVLESL